MYNRKNKDELLKEINEKLNLGHNFVDYFLTIGTNPNVFQEKWLYESDISELNNKYKEELKPIIINKFPPNDKKLVGLDEAIIFHCFPNGFEVREFNKQPEYKIFSILLDNNNYSINYPFKYVVCLKFYESINNYKKLYDKYIDYSELNVPKDTELEENISISLPVSKNRKTTFTKDLKYNHNLDIYCPEPFDGDNGNNENELNSSNRKYNLGKSFHEKSDIRSNFTNKENKESYKYRKYYIPKCICLISLYPYIIELSKIIKSIYHYSLVEKQILPLEKIINNLLVEVPTPPKGIYYVDYSLINESIILRANQMNDLHTLNIEFERLFTVFNLENILELFRYLMLNAKVIIFSEEIKNLTPVILSVLSLLYPFNYPYTVVSILHKEAYKILDNITPVLVGINEKYNKNFLKENDIDICDFTLIINMDKQELIKLGESKNKKLPQLPSKYKDNLENKINNYILEIKKNKKQNGRGESSKALQKKIRTFFLEFQIELMKDYSKYLNNDIYKHQDDGKTPLENAFKLKEFLKKVPSEYSNFYKYFSETQMFCDFIYKRMMPRDKNEQIDILYFEEKLLKNKTESIFLNSSNYKIVKKYGVPKPTPLSPQEIYYFNNLDIRNKLILNGIEITNRKDININRGKSFTIAKKNSPNYYNHNISHDAYDNSYINDDEIFSNNFERKTMSFHTKNEIPNNKKENYLNQNSQGNQPLFSYYIFPKLNNEYFFRNDVKNYYVDYSIYQEVKNIDNDLLSKSHLRIIEIKTNETTNYINLVWLKMWVATYYYHDKQEQKYRFFQMLNILEKINQHEMGVVNNLFTVLVKSQIDEDLLLLLYEKILHYQFIPSSFIFKTVRNIINSIKTKLKLKTFNISKYVKSIEDKIKKDLKDSKKARKYFRKRTIRSIYDTQILDEKVTFLMEENCNECDKKINMYDFMKNLKEINDDLLWAKCPYCGYNYLPKLKVVFGTENNKNNRLISTTSIVDEVILYSPKTLNYNMFDATKNNYNINIEDFKSNYNPFFWNIIWYFKMKKIPFDFILPYEDNIFYYFLNNKQKNQEDQSKEIEKAKKLKISKNFKIKFSPYVKQKDNLKFKKKNWNKKNELIISLNEIEIFIPSKKASSYVMRTYSNASHYSDYPSVINVNDFEIDSQISIDRTSFGSFVHRDSIVKNIKINQNNDDKFKNNNFNSSIQIIKIDPKKRREFFLENTEDNPMNSYKRNEFLSSSSKKMHFEYSSSLQYRKNTDVIKILRDNKSNDNDFISSTSKK
jgi:hypothetical protein